MNINIAHGSQQISIESRACILHAHLIKRYDKLHKRMLYRVHILFRALEKKKRYKNSKRWMKRLGLNRSIRHRRHLSLFLTLLPLDLILHSSQAP